MDLLAEEPPIRLDDQDWPIHTYAGKRGAARLLHDATVQNDLLSAGCRVFGAIETR